MLEKIKPRAIICYDKPFPYLDKYGNPTRKHAKNKQVGEIKIY